MIYVHTRQVHNTSKVVDLINYVELILKASQAGAFTVGVLLLGHMT